MWLRRGEDVENKFGDVGEECLGRVRGHSMDKERSGGKGTEEG